MQRIERGTARQEATAPDEAGATPDAVGKAGSTDTITVCIADRLPLVCEGLRSLLAAERDIRVLGVSSRADSVLKQIEAGGPSLALVDYELPDGSPLDLLDAVNALNPETRVLFLAPPLDGQSLLELLSNGSSGVVERSSSRERILDAIRAAAGGRIVLSAAIGLGPAERA